MADVAGVFRDIAAFVAGAVVTALVSWFFYRKADYAAKVTTSLADNILLLMIQSRLGVPFNAPVTLSAKDLPKDLGIPHILHYCLTPGRVNRGQSFHLLLRVRDTGLDLPGSEAVRVRETEHDVRFASAREGHGYYSCNASCPTSATPGIHRLEVQLEDDKGNKNTQFIEFEVMAPPTNTKRPR